MEGFRLGRGEGEAEVAQVCLNGHVASGCVEREPYRMADYCETCSEPTIMACQNDSCKVPIRGLDGREQFQKYLTAYCRACAGLFPWTERRIEGAQELILLVEGLDDEGRETLTTAFVELMKDTPKTQLFAAQFKQFIVDTQGIATDMLVEMAKKAFTKDAQRLIFGA